MQMTSESVNAIERRPRNRQNRCFVPKNYVDAGAVMTFGTDGTARQPNRQWKYLSFSRNDARNIVLTSSKTIFSYELSRKGILRFQTYE